MCRNTFYLFWENMPEIFAVLLQEVFAEHKFHEMSKEVERNSGI